MGVDEFERWWRVQQRSDIVRMITALDGDPHRRDPDVGHARACAEVEVLLRRSGRDGLGRRAAHRLRIAVVEACRRTGVLEDDHPGAVLLARAAGEAARALVCERQLACVDEVLAPFRSQLERQLAV